MGGLQGNNLLVTSAAFTAKVASWTTAQVSGDGGCRPLVALQNNGYQPGDHLPFSRDRESFW